MKKTVLFLSVVSILFSGGCLSRRAEKEIIRSVRVDTVRAHGEEQRVLFPGKVRAASDVSLSFRVSGTILRVYVDAGSYVRQGEALAQIDPRDYETQLAATEAEYRQIKGEAERVIGLYEKNSVSPNDYEKALYGLQQITAKYEAHRNALSDTKLVAPFDGYVQKRLFDANETVSAGMPVISMISARQPEVEINLPASEFIARDRFDSYTASVDIYPGETFLLDPVGISRKANLNQLYTMRLRFRQASVLPSPGMAAMVMIRLKPEESGLVSIPLNAVFGEGGESCVWVYDPQESVVHRRSVRLREILTRGTVLLSEGVAPGEIIVSAGVHALTEGEEVRLLPAVSSTNVGGLL